MNIYYLQGVIHPRRAQIKEHPFKAKFQHVASGNSAELRAQILMNELSIRVETIDDWDIFDLRNVARYLTQTELALIGYLVGCAYIAEIVRVTCEAKDIDVVYGIDIPSIGNRSRTVDFKAALSQLKQFCLGKSGVFFQRCMNDLLLAMQHPEDTAFFCYRALEALKNHFISNVCNPPANKSAQWEEFRSLVQCSRADIDFIKNEADPLRHADNLIFSREDRETLFARTWDIVEAYVTSFSNKQMQPPR